MSKTKINNLLRMALYEAYGGKCFYSGMPIDYQDFQVDHIIPEALGLELEAIKSKLGLDESFQINCVENLVPCKPGLNNRKNDELFPENTIRYYLGQTNSKKGKVLKLLDMYQQKRNRGNVYKAIDKELAKGDISLKELKEYVQTKMMEEFRNKKIKLNYPIRLENGVVDELAVSDDYNNLVAKPLELFDEGKGVRPVNDAADEVEVHTLSEWKEYTEKDFFPNTNADIRVSAAFEYLDALLVVLDVAEQPKTSFFDGETMKDLVSRFSVKTLMDVEDELTESTVGELLQNGKLEIFEISDTSVTIRCCGFINTFMEQLRADLTHDGLENIFCYVWRNADGGSMGWGETMILGCHSKEGLVEQEVAQRNRGTGSCFR